ncbi:hypothetical protein CPB83DRAFT_907811 [Crepidotus variabilis]|uniref:Uncharacterized protein n=1 Tax=Crepidotus variabilis TaxID=179855 RepID=A0A9P6EE06_9AGAR|nr:hypothetical protein CPB83DRAFT_907811 [Crepidotus variabilis]
MSAPSKSPYDIAAAYLNSTDFSKLPNPLALEAWTPLATSSYFRTFIYIFYGGFSVLVWDILQSIPKEYEFIKTSQNIVHLVTYVTARISPVVFLVLTMMNGGSYFRSLLASSVLIVWLIPPAATSLDPCALDLAISIFYSIAINSTCLLFFFRVRAVFPRNYWFTGFVSLIWLMSVASSILYTVERTTIPRVPPFITCLKQTKGQYGALMISMQASYELLVCASITGKLGYRAVVDSGVPLRHAGFWFMIRNQPFSLIRRRILQDNQIYFAVAFTFKFVEILMYTKLDSSMLAAVIEFLDVIVLSLLATKIVRDLKLGQGSPFTWDQRHSTIIRIPHGTSHRS